MDLAIRHYENAKKDMDGKGNLSTFLQRLRLRISARNHLHGVVIAITARMQSLVPIQVSANFIIQLRVSRNAILDMGLAIGNRISAVFKAASVQLNHCHPSGDPSGCTTWPATLRSEGGDSKNREVTLNICGQNTIVALVDKEHWNQLELDGSSGLW